MRASRIKKIVSSLGLMLASTCMVQSAEAATLVLGASTQAWYSEDGTNSATRFGNVGAPIFNTFTGMQNNVEFRSYFVFSLNGVTEAIAGGTLKLLNKRYYSSVPNETIELFDVSTPATDLVTGVNQPTYFDDLGTGRSYGTADIFAQPPTNDFDNVVEEFFEVTLSQAAIADINLALEQSIDTFAIGIRLQSLDDTPYAFQTVNRSTEGVVFSGGAFDPLKATDFPAELILDTVPLDPVGIPEPSKEWSIWAFVLAGGILKCVQFFK